MLHHGSEFKLEHHGRLCDVIALAPAWVQLANKSDRLPSQHDPGASARVHSGMISRLKHRPRRSQQGFYIALDVKKINALFFAPPLQRISIASQKAGHPHRLVKALHRGVAIGH